REAALILEDAVRLAHECRDIDALGMALGTLADVHERLAEVGRAKECLLEMLQIARACEAGRYISEMECRLGSLAFIEGDWAEARGHFNAAMLASGIS